MATARDIITRALRRIRVTPIMAEPAAEESSHALDCLNDMLTAYEADGLTTETVITTGNTSNGSRSITGLNSSANLRNTDHMVVGMQVSGTGVVGIVHEIVSLDEIKLDRAATATGTGVTLTFRALPMDDSMTQGLVALLAMRLCEDYGVTPGPILIRDAKAGEAQIDAAYLKIPESGVDNALRRASSGNYERDGVSNG